MSGAVAGLTQAFARSPNSLSGLLEISKDTGVRISDYLLHQYPVLLYGVLGVAFSLAAFIFIVVCKDRVSFVHKAAVTRFQTELQSVEGRDSDEEERVKVDPDIPKLRHIKKPSASSSSFFSSCRVSSRVSYTIRILFHLALTIGTAYLCFSIWESENTANTLTNASHCVAFSIADFFISGELPSDQIISDLAVLTTESMSWDEAIQSSTLTNDKILDTSGSGSVYRYKSLEGLKNWYLSDVGSTGTSQPYASTLSKLKTFSGWKGISYLASNSGDAFDMLTGNPSSQFSGDAATFKQMVAEFNTMQAHAEGDLDLLIAAADSIKSQSILGYSYGLAEILVHTQAATPALDLRVPLNVVTQPTDSVWNSAITHTVGAVIGPLTVLRQTFFDSVAFAANSFMTTLQSLASPPAYAAQSPPLSLTGFISDLYQSVFFSPATSVTASTKYPNTGPDLTIMQVAQQVHGVLTQLKSQPLYREGGTLFIRYTDLRGTLVYMCLALFISLTMIGFTFVLLGGPLSCILPVKPPDSPPLIVCVLSIVSGGFCIFVYMVTTLSGAFFGDAAEFALQVLHPSLIVEAGPMFSLTSSSTGVSDSSLKEWLVRIGTCTVSSNARLLEETSLDPNYAGSIGASAASAVYSQARSTLADTSTSTFWSEFTTWTIDRAHLSIELLLGELLDSTAAPTKVMLGLSDASLLNAAGVSTVTLTGVDSWSASDFHPLSFTASGTYTRPGTGAVDVAFAEDVSDLCALFLKSPRDGSLSTNPLSLKCTPNVLKSFARAIGSRVIHNLNFLRSEATPLASMFTSSASIQALDAFIRSANSNTVREATDACGFLSEVLTTDIPFWFGNVAAALDSTGKYWGLMTILLWFSAILFFNEWEMQIRKGLSKRAFPYDRSMLVVDERQGSTMYPQTLPFGAFLTFKTKNFLAKWCGWCCVGPTRRSYKRMQALSGVKIAKDFEERAAHLYLTQRREEAERRETLRRRQLLAAEGGDGSDGVSLMSGAGGYKIASARGSLIASSNADHPELVGKRLHVIKSDLLGMKNLVEEYKRADILIDESLERKKKRWEELRRIDKADLLVEEQQELDALDREMKFILRRSQNIFERRFSILVDELMLARQESEVLRGGKISTLFTVGEEEDDEDEEEVEENIINVERDEDEDEDDNENEEEVEDVDDFTKEGQSPKKTPR